MSSTKLTESIQSYLANAAPHESGTSRSERFFDASAVGLGLLFVWWLSCRFQVLNAQYLLSPQVAQVLKDKLKSAFRRHPKLREIVLTQLPGRVSYTMLTSEGTDIQKIGDMAFACALSNTPIKVKQLVNRRFIPAKIQLLTFSGDVK